jgi:hypothetical protein
VPKIVTVRFYQIGKVSAHAPTLRVALSQIEALGQPGFRERQLAAGFRCRLERFTATPGYLTGEITRVRSDDFPSEVHPHGTTVLNVGVPIGEGVAFRYRESDHVLAIQYDPRVVSPGRFIDYVNQLVPAAQFLSKPKVDANALAHFRAHPLKKVRIKLARPQDLRNVEPSMQSAARAFRTLGRDYAAPLVTLEMSVGHEDSSLSRDAKRMIEGFVRRAAVGSGVKSIKVRPDNGPGEENAEVNLLDALLSVKDTIDRPSNDPQSNYDARRRIVQSALNAHN